MFVFYKFVQHKQVHTLRAHSSFHLVEQRIFAWLVLFMVCDVARVVQSGNKSGNNEVNRKIKIHPVEILHWLRALSWISICIFNTKRSKFKQTALLLFHERWYSIKKSEILALFTCISHVTTRTCSKSRNKRCSRLLSFTATTRMIKLFLCQHVRCKKHIAKNFGCIYACLLSND